MPYTETTLTAVNQKRKMKKKWIILAIMIGGYGVYALLTGGIVFYNVKGFGGQRNITLVEGLQSDIWINSNLRGGGIPFIGFYHYTKLPYSLLIQIWDESQEYSKMVISHISVAYADGEIKDFPMNWERSLKAYTRVNSSSNGLVRTPMMMLSDDTPSIIDRYCDVSITIEGNLITRNKEVIHFKTTEQFKYEADLDVSTYWEMIASC